MALSKGVPIVWRRQDHKVSLAIIATIHNVRATFLLDQVITVSDATGGSFMITLDLTASGGSVQTSGEIAYNADATGGRTSVQGILEVLRRMCCRFCCNIFV